MENLNQEIINENNYENEESSMKVHTIGGYETMVIEAGYKHQEHSFDISMVTGVTETRLSDLNDECLETIFSLEFISITDLCAIARTNQRLMNVANRIFSLKHKSYSLLLSKISDAKRVISTFGFLISDLLIGEDKDFGDEDKANEDWTNEDWIDLLNLVIRYCSKTLDTLKIDQLLIPMYLTSGLKKLFSNLQKLCFYGCWFQGSDNLLLHCKKLVELTVSVENLFFHTEEALVRFTMDNIFPKLERLTLDVGNSKDLAIFLSRHKNLKSLNIWGCDDSSSLLPIIAISCTHLENLSIDIAILADKYGKVIESLQMLEHLRTLTLYCNSENITESIPKLNSLKSLEYLELFTVRADSDFPSAISQLKKLQVLRLINFVELVNLNRLADITKLTELTISSVEVNLDIVLLVKQLNSLKTLNILVQTYELDKKTYLNLVTVVRNRPIRSQQSLKIGCFIAYKDLQSYADLQNDQNNRQIVELLISVKPVLDVKL